MSRKKRIYNIVNIAVILLAAVIFIYDNGNISEAFSGKKFLSIIVLLMTVAIVHSVKAGRLYLALYGSNIDAVTYVKVYCKVTPVSVVIPFKLGEFFRMYCYGKQLGSALKGVVIILWDRFMDTVALITAILLVCVVKGGRITSFVYMLLVFLVFVLLIYFVYPGVHKFWKRYLLRAKATEHKLAALKMLDTLNTIYGEIENVAKGRGIILYFMSLIAWGAEIGSLMLLNGISVSGDIGQVITDYLTSAMSGSQSIELKQFVVVSVGLLIVLYLIIKIVELIAGKKVHG